MLHQSPQPHSGGTPEVPPILVVDDDPQLRGVIRLALEEEGLVVETAADGRQALDQATSRRPRLVILDMGLPLFDGAEFAAKLRALYGDGVPVVVMTADGNVVQKARRAGARAYLSKPFELDELSAVVQQVLDGG
jgi:two-component system chemotaxis response regulator CheY